MDVNKKGWFTELSPMWPGQGMCLKIDKVLVDKQTNYQHLQIFESSNYGKVLVLDGAIQLTERDEFAYHEMMAFMALNSHPNPRKVLIIGGGDGGVVREVAKHPAVESIVMCEIDDQVVEACKEHIPSVACGFSDARFSLHVGDGLAFLAACQDRFDVIITDASDPAVNDAHGNQKDGPAVTLFNEEYYTALRNCLADDGILLSQGESPWLHRELIGKLISKSRTLYPVVRYSYTCVPTYPSGQIGLILCSKNKNTDFSKPVTIFSEAEQEKMGLKYYSSEMHAASLVLPRFMKDL